MTIFYIKKIISTLMIAAGISLIVIGINREALPFTVYLELDAQTYGSIEEYYSPYSDDRSDVMYPIISYTVKDKEYRHIGTAEVGEYPYSENFDVIVSYDSNDPEESMIKAELYDALKSFAIYAAAGIVFMIVAIIIAPREKIFAKDLVKKKEESKDKEEE